MFGEWITEKILYPLPHRQYVFTLPKMLRPYFRFDFAGVSKTTCRGGGLFNHISARIGDSSALAE
jgi:hypothetical protein